MKKILFTQSPFFLAILVVLSGCGSDHSKPNIELIQDFMVSPSLKAQEADDSFANGSGAQVPPENTVPVGFTPYLYKDINVAARELKNPFEGNNSEDVLMVGQKYYETHCMVCHGVSGKGDGPVAEKMVLRPPSLLTAKIRGWEDGRLYHTITMGQGVMGPYASHIPQKYRWQVVSYIRFMQKNNQE